MARFVKGQSGNPAGRPKGQFPTKQVMADIRLYCKQHSMEAVEALVDVMNSKSSPPSARVAAANSILDRGFGKPQMEITTTINIYDNMDERALVDYITGNVIEGEVIQALVDAEHDRDEQEQEELLDDAHAED